MISHSVRLHELTWKALSSWFAIEGAIATHGSCIVEEVSWNYPDNAFVMLGIFLKASAHGARAARHCIF
jgi:hypothetical protein